MTPTRGDFGLMVFMCVGNALLKLEYRGAAAHGGRGRLNTELVLKFL